MLVSGLSAGLGERFGVKVRLDDISDVLDRQNELSDRILVQNDCLDPLFFVFIAFVWVNGGYSVGRTPLSSL